MEDQKFYLDQEELRDYHIAARAEEPLKEQLEQLLEGESLRLFKRYTENRDEGGHLYEVSCFRKGLAMGLKLGTFYASEH